MKLNKEFKIGFFGILMIGLLYWGINFLKGTDLFSSDVKYYAVYDQVNGLESSASILIKGFKVGSISDISYDPARSQNVVVEFSISSKYPIPDDTKARIFSDGIMGGKAVELVLGKSTQYLQEGDTLFSEINKDFLEVAGSEFEFIKQRANNVISQLVTTLGHINALLADNKENLDRTFNNIANLSGNLNEVVENEKGSIHSIVTDLNHLTQTLSAKSGQIDRIITNVETFSDSLNRASIPTLVTQLNETVGRLNTVMGKIEQGDGSVGKLINDDALYDSLVQASSDLAALLADIKAHPSRYVNISVFGRRDKN